MKIAIIGGGISGMVAAYLLNQDHDITLFEANDYLGGHTHTVDVQKEGNSYAVDTGFIVFNEKTYPNFCRLLDQLDVPYQPSTMTFSVKCEKTRLEYSPHTLNTFFGQRKNLISPPFYRMIYDILRFRSKLDRLALEESESALGDYLAKNGYSGRFIDYFVIPLASSLWSADPKEVYNFPLQTFVLFFKNHGFLETSHPIEWKVIKGGSRQYVEKIIVPYADKIRLSTAVRKVSRHKDHVDLITDQGESDRFDHVVMAVHSDQALKMLADPSPVEKEILGTIPYQENTTTLHTDSTVLPERQQLWSSWNYLIPREEINRAILTYNMNRLQTIKAPVTFCVTLNKASGIDERQVLGNYVYHHPVYLIHSPMAQKRHEEISGKNRTHYCGAYWGYGFHEDGVNSALAACRYFGKGL